MSHQDNESPGPDNDHDVRGSAATRPSRAPRWADEQLLLTPEAAARALHLGRTTIYALIKDQQLHAIHIGRCCRLSRAELLRYVTHLDQPLAQSPRTARVESLALAQHTMPDKRGRRRPAANQDRLFDLDPIPPDAG